MAEFVLQLQDIDDSGKGYTFELTPEWLDAALADSPVRRNPSATSGWLHVHAQRNGQELLVQGHVEVELVTECARCLGDAPLPVQTEVTALLCQGADPAAPDELELETEELDRVRFVGHEVALDELIREHLLLECPMQPLCSTQCPGIAIPERVRPRAEDFGDGTGVDPRLLPLKQLRQKLSGNQE
jgi:uncharacterized protein